MPKINVLAKNVAELVAAGEVVERPASAVKELVENSIDAGAKTITVEIKNGGVSYIRVADDASGIPRDEIRTAFLSHATSKIASPEDLNGIITLGFRGEALASVRAVARVEVLTRTADETVGTRYVIEGGEELLLDDAGCPRGTVIIVRDLFYRTPARMKFLKKDATEANAVAGAVDGAALSHPEISFRFIRDGKKTLSTSGNGDLSTCAREVLGKEFASNLIPVKLESEGIKVSGFVSKPAAARSNRNMQFFFLNGRYIKTRTCSAALSEGYKNSITAGKFPSCLLYLEIDPSLVDVNVRPSKTEVRFSDERAAFNAVFYACKNALLSGDSPKQFEKSAGGVRNGKPAENIKITRAPAPNPEFWTRAEKTGVPPRITVYELPGSRQNQEPKKFSQINSPRDGAEKEKKTDEILPAGEPQAARAHKEETAGSADFAEEEFLLIGEAFGTYIICEYQNKLVFIDKHAAHERVIYENLKRESGARTPQILLSPVAAALSKEESAAIIENSELLGEAGFAVEDFGDGCVLVRECPMELAPDDVEGAICEIAGRFLEKKRDVSFEKMDWIFRSVACRSAIKAGDFTSRFEMERFAKTVLSSPELRYCPHGRPIIVETTKRELEKNFDRV